MVADVIKWH